MAAKYKNRRSKLDIWVIRVTKTGELKNSYPCNECLKFMKSYGIDRVYYSDDNGEIVCEKLNDMKSKHISTGHQARRDNSWVSRKSFTSSSEET